MTVDHPRERRILIVEEEPSLRRLLRRALHRWGFAVVEAVDGEEGIRQALEHRPDLVIFDIRMPVLDGCALAASLRADPRTARTPIVLMSANVAPGDARRAAGLGDVTCVDKPYSLHDLLGQIHERLGCC